MEVRARHNQNSVVQPLLTGKQSLRLTIFFINLNLFYSIEGDFVKLKI